MRKLLQKYKSDLLAAGILAILTLIYFNGFFVNGAKVLFSYSNFLGNDYLVQHMGFETADPEINSG